MSELAVGTVLSDGQMAGWTPMQREKYRERTQARLEAVAKVAESRPALRVRQQDVEALPPDARAHWEMLRSLPLRDLSDIVVTVAAPRAREHHAAPGRATAGTASSPPGRPSDDDRPRLSAPARLLGRLHRRRCL